MSENVYEGLRELLDTHPVGCPYAPEIIGILKILFSEEEASVSLGFGFRPFNTEVIAQRACVETQKAGELLESLANKGLVFAREKNGVKGYALLNPIQIFENPYRKGVHDKTIHKLTPL